MEERLAQARRVRAQEVLRRPIEIETVNLRLDEAGRLRPLPAGVDLSSTQLPLRYLALALGGCLLQVARRFLERRRRPRRCEAVVTWELDPRRAELRTLHVDLRPAATLSAEERVVLHRMLALCPVHKALSPGVAVEITLGGAPLAA